MTAPIVIHDAYAGEVWCWQDGCAEASASSVGVYQVDVMNGLGWWMDLTAIDACPCLDLDCLAYRKHLELRDR